ncbi:MULTISPECIES: helix-turn-helix transcriptional regulator [unclassified Streptomyces]|uniref:helix-turn-helix transcriptional regulator n=1 Tax=unclassified Streptomyces TaxID=2593676 RepID=UPI00081D7C1E|nr:MULTISPECIES: helix-turn-helix transcriptional regulator [unclassified Streptomyces]MYZ35996.1 helix-turn-helix domain-containing protein [Streptomyces sp. SID4917]SCF80105.1 Helix-turn-helix [Streptomyces sp. MnatMP-M17]
MPSRRFDGSSLRALRRSRELPQQWLADKLGVTHVTIAGWENGKRFPPFDRLPAIAEAFGLPLDELFPREGRPDLADLRCDAGYPQQATGELIGAKSHVPVSNAERGVRRLAPEYVPALARAYGVSEGDILAAQDRSFGLTPPPADVSARAPQTLAEKITYLLLHTFPNSTPPSDAQIADAINGKIGRPLLSTVAVAALRTGTPPPAEVLADIPETPVYEGLADTLGVTPLFFQSNEAVERQVLEGISLLATNGGTTDSAFYAVAARGGHRGVSPSMLARVRALVAELQENRHAGGKRP